MKLPLSFKERTGVRMVEKSRKERPILILSFPLKGKGPVAEDIKLSSATFGGIHVY
jgi:hypothetical protein